MRRIRRITVAWRLAAGVALLAVLPFGAVTAQDRPAEGDDGPAQETLREAMRDYFRNQLRMELALSDDEMAELVPLIEQIESVRGEARRERAATLRGLRRGMREGAADAELEHGLQRLDAIDTNQREREQQLVARIDELLTVRQRVEFRFFTQRFRQELQRRVQELRRDRMGP